MTQEQTILKGRDIVIISIQPWYYELGSNCKNIATHFAKHNRVLYVNTPVTRRTYWAKNKTKGIEDHCNVIKTKSNTIRTISENFWEFYPSTLHESINWISSTFFFRIINKINCKRLASDIKKALAELNFKDVIIFVDNDIYNSFHLKELLNPGLFIYYCRDFLQGYDFYKNHAPVMEPELIKKADLVTTNSTCYSEYCAQFNKNTGYMGQGCNLDLFDKDKVVDLPEEVKPIPHPVIGYVGALDSARLDHAIIKILAQSNPDWQIVLVGPEDEAFLESDLHLFGNIHFLGRKQIKQLPAFIKSFDVCINPQLINPITTGNYPLKIDEYLAIGKPVVATRTKAMKLFEEYTYLADTAEDYPALIEKALSENTPQKETARINFAKSHTWENSMISLYKAIKDYGQANQNSL